jgi:hypothetical protein
MHRAIMKLRLIMRTPLTPIRFMQPTIREKPQRLMQRTAKKRPDRPEKSRHSSISPGTPAAPGDLSRMHAMPRLWL